MWLMFSTDFVILFLLMFFRVLSIVMVLPVLGSDRVSTTAKVGLGFFLTFIAFAAFRPRADAVPATFAAVTAAAVIEMFIGLAMGFTVKMAVEGINFAGNMAGFQMGFSLARVVDPQEGMQVSLIGNFLILMASLIFVVSGLYRHFIAGIVNSFAVLGPGQAVLRPATLDRFIRIGGEMFVNAVRVGAPWIIVLMLTKVGLGLMARTFPQMNVIFVAFPVTIALGLITISMAAPFLVATIMTLFGEAEGHFWFMLRAAMPG